MTASRALTGRTSVASCHMPARRRAPPGTAPGAPPGAPPGAARRGSTLLLALGALVILGVLVAALATMVVATGRDVRSAAAIDRVGLAAENAMAELRSAWDARESYRAERGLQTDDAIGEIAIVRRAVLLPAGVVRVAVQANAMDAADPAARARRIAQGYLRRRPPPLDVPAAVIAAGSVTIGPDAGIHGTDLIGSTGCAADATSRAALVVDDLASVDVEPGGTLSGLPPVATGASAAVTSVASALDALTRPAVHVTGAVTAPTFVPALEAGACAFGGGGAPSTINAGDPDGVSACASYWPYVHVRGDLTLPTGSGQGILRVDGDLRVAADFRWRGLIVVHGDVDLAGPDVVLHGMLVAAGGGLASHRFAAGTSVVRSACAVRRALVSSAPVTPLTGAAWAGLP